MVVILVPILVLMVVILVPSGTIITYGICLIVILAVGLFYNFKKPKQAEQPEQIKNKIRPTL